MGRESENQDETKKAIVILKEEIEKGIQSIMEGEEFKAWLDTTSRFYTTKYSINNAILIHRQKPDASFTMGYEAWKSYGRIPVKNSGIKILAPVIAYEKKEGALFSLIRNNLNGQLKKDPDLSIAAYRIGNSNLEFTMNRNGLIGLKVNGAEVQIFNNESDAKKFLERAVIGKVPMYYTVSHVFDISDTVIPEFLWMKKGYKASEVVHDDEGNPIKNKRGETKIYNTSERIKSFQLELDLNIPEQDKDKMNILADILKTISNKSGVPVVEREKSEDDVLQGGAEGYYSRKFTEELPKGYICIDQTLSPTKKCSVLIHEIAHSHLHIDLARLAQNMQIKNVSREMREIQAEATAYMTAKQFGIETATSSFKYLATFSNGFEFQDFKQSLNVIYNEFISLTNEIKDELESKGLDMSLEKTDHELISPEKINEIAKSYMKSSIEEEDHIDARKRKVFMDMYEYRDQPVRAVLQKESALIDVQTQEIRKIQEYIRSLESASIREEQDSIIQKLEKARERLQENHSKFNEIEQEKQEMNKVPVIMKIMQDLQDDTLKQKLHNCLEQYSAYITSSDYLQKLCLSLQNKPREAADMILKQIDAIQRVSSENGMFVEIQECDNELFESPLIREGTLCHPKIADYYVNEIEKKVYEDKKNAEKSDVYLPYIKCRMALYDSQNKATMLYLRLGLGEQDSLGQYIAKKYPNLAVSYQNAIKEGISKELQISEPSFPKNSKKIDDEKEEKYTNQEEKNESREEGLSMKEWKQEIGKVRENHDEEGKDGRELSYDGRKEHFF